ncbi:unnamed protein product [Ectocarpus sp. CCAP 1310/34]|nr:unnamed protein product [Ectocarpus sp. CCAP 1310/34]
MEVLVAEDKEEEALEKLGASQAEQEFDDKVAYCDFWESFQEWEESQMCGEWDLPLSAPFGIHNTDLEDSDIEYFTYPRGCAGDHSDIDVDIDVADGGSASQQTVGKRAAQRGM